jgi:hypothetical protein
MYWTCEMKDLEVCSTQFLRSKWIVGDIQSKPVVNYKSQMTTGHFEEQCGSQEYEERISGI